MNSRIINIFQLAGLFLSISHYFALDGLRVERIISHHPAFVPQLLSLFPFPITLQESLKP
ncbi:hypothetical protein [Profundibacterium mesophilum]|uniref:Uncharacterized protein n=1 Tax=Profundibacterium mesophilum KAUST100406-0324 TaxID=1037889 RepID=A0A921TBM3_9RHOB|nr:hypothetical protein [Profundibacterium mesophilum]KAF0675885.1 hypothetical protein PMES_01775 [Profundibacterium mesophilum KAUST100406-0324]